MLKTNEFEQKVAETIRRFKLTDKKEKLLVACSGGKDSTAILYVLKKQGYNVEAITVDTLIGNYTAENLANLRRVCKELGVKLHVISFRKEFGYSLCYLKSILKDKGVKLKSCAICGVLRKYLLNKYARKLKASKLVTGHNLDDEAQSILMNLMKHNLEILARLGPLPGVRKDIKFVQRIKPLMLIHEDDIISYSKAKNFPVNYNACPCRTESYRNQVSILLDELEKKNPKIKENIVNYFLEILPSLKKKYKQEGQRYCIKCKEPSKDEICMSCQILGKLN